MLAQIVGLALGVYNPAFWVKVDAAAIVGNGANDTLLATFHRQRLTWRIATSLGVAAAAAVPMYAIAGSLPYALLVVAQLVFWSGYFFAKFNQGLNISLMPTQPYKNRWFVSWNPKGSWVDGLLWRKAWQAQGYPLPAINGPHPATQALAGGYLRSLSNLSKLAAIAGYTLLILAVWLILSA